MKEDYYGVGIIPEDSIVGKLYFHEIEYVPANHLFIL